MWHPLYFAILLIFIWFVYAIFAYYIWYIRYGERTHPFPWFLTFFGFENRYLDEVEDVSKYEYYKLVILYLLSKNGQLEGNNFNMLNWYYNNIMSNNAKNDQAEMEDFLSMISANDQNQQQQEINKESDQTNKLQKEILNKIKELIPSSSSSSSTENNFKKNNQQVVDNNNNNNNDSLKNDSNKKENVVVNNNNKKKVQISPPPAKIQRIPKKIFK